MSPDMKGLCFRCLREGHFRHDCTNPIVCIRCGEEGHGTRGCKRPRSPTSEAELCRQAEAMVARRTSRSATPSNSSLPPPPPPSLALVEAWPRLGAQRPLPPAPRLQMQMDTDMVPLELCVVRRTPAMDDLERRLQLAMVVYAGGARREISPEFVVEAL
nr:serine/arginine-rich splicing factor RS2Z33-like [Aegilops tauschii subsp. strangulata]